MQAIAYFRLPCPPQHKTCSVQQAVRSPFETCVTFFPNCVIPCFKTALRRAGVGGALELFPLFSPPLGMQIAQLQHCPDWLQKRSARRPRREPPLGSVFYYSGTAANSGYRRGIKAFFDRLVFTRFSYTLVSE